jgi:hypothetical protein
LGYTFLVRLLGRNEHSENSNGNEIRIRSSDSNIETNINWRKSINKSVRAQQYECGCHSRRVYLLLFSYVSADVVSKPHAAKLGITSLRDPIPMAKA